MPAQYWQLAVAALALIIAAEVILQAVLAVGTGHVPPPNPQERAVAHKAARNGYVLLSFGVVMTLIGFSLAVTPFVIANGLLLIFVGAEIVKLASQLIGYRPMA